MREVLLDAFLLIKGIEIARNPAEDPICQQPLLFAVMWKKGRAIEVIERQDFHLSRYPAVKRALVPHDIIDMKLTPEPQSTNMMFCCCHA